MATFTIAVEGTEIIDLLVLENSTSDSCDSTFIFSMNGTKGDSMSLAITVDSGTGTNNFTVNSIPQTTVHAFTSNGIDSLIIYMKNSATSDTLQITVALNNTTEATNDSEVIRRISTGTIC